MKNFDFKILAIGLISLVVWGLVVWYNSVVGLSLGFIVFFKLINGYSFLSITISSILFSFILIFERAFWIDLWSKDIIFRGQFALFLIFVVTQILFLIIGLTRLLPYILLNLNSKPLKCTFISLIILIGVAISFSIDPVKADFYLYLNTRKKAVSLIESGQLETVQQLMKNNPQYFRSNYIEIKELSKSIRIDARSIEISNDWSDNRNQNGNDNAQTQKIIRSIFFERYTLGSAEIPGGYIYDTGHWQIRE
jgi:hypothetical protein